jgi:hypothetical protein
MYNQSLWETLSTFLVVLMVVRLWWQIAAFVVAFIATMFYLIVWARSSLWTNDSL